MLMLLEKYKSIGSLSANSSVKSRLSATDIKWRVQSDCVPLKLTVTSLEATPRSRSLSISENRLDRRVGYFGRI